MQWVNVKERLPESRNTVLIFKEGYWDEAGMGYFEDVWRDAYQYIEQTNVTHWMPLPEPPTASNNVINPTSK